MSLVLSENVYELAEYAERLHQVGRFESGKSTARTSIAIEADLTDVALLFPALRSHQISADILLISGTNTFIKCSRVDQVTEVVISGDWGEIDKIKKYIVSVYPEVPLRITWMYSADGDRIKLPISTENKPRTEFYPQLGTETLESYYNRYSNSTSNVLVLLGPPGTGKTSFLRGYLLHTNSRALVSYDAKILDDDSIFARFMSGKESVMILEDADSFLSSRAKHGNTIMHKFLNIADGLVSNPGKKIIFTTNLPSTRDIDPALIRPGRCFDVLRFRRLTPAEAQVVDTSYTGTDDVSLAELLCQDSNKNSNSPDRVGF